MSPQTFPLEEAARAHQAGETGRTQGKLVLTILSMARIVLVHGAFGGAWCWEPVISPLEGAGHTVEAFDLPGGGSDDTPVADVTLESCAARVGDVLGRRPEAAVLVGHSMGGIVITQAAATGPTASPRWSSSAPSCPRTARASSIWRASRRATT